MAILTLTRIFLLTHGHQTLLREITTPSIGPFVTSCLNSVTLKAGFEESKVTDLRSPLLNIMLQSFIKLLSNHPASFRPFISHIRSILAPLFAPTPSTLPASSGSHLPNIFSPQATTALAQRLHALLPQCAAKSGSSEEWSKYVHLVLDDINRTAGLVFRAVRESQPRAIDADAVGLSEAETVEDEISDAPENELQLPAWNGIYAGCERLIGLLQVLQAYLATRTSSSVTVPVAIIFATLERILSVFAPDPSVSKEAQMEFNAAILRDERDAMFSILPNIHAATIECCSLLVARMAQSFTSLAPELLDQLSWLLQRTRTTYRSRNALYNLSTQLVELSGPTLSSKEFEQLAPILRHASHDLLLNLECRQRTKQPGPNTPLQRGQKPLRNNADAILGSLDGSTNQFSASQPPKRHQQAPQRLISVSMAILPPELVPASVRTGMDRAAVLLQSEQALLSSIVNPGKSSRGTQLATPLPFLSRMHPRSLSTEVLLRPRMPYIRRRQEQLELELLEEEENEIPEIGSQQPNPFSNFNIPDGMNVTKLPQPVSNDTFYGRQQDINSDHQSATPSGQIFAPRQAEPGANVANKNLDQESTASSPRASNSNKKGENPTEILSSTKRVHEPSMVLTAPADPELVLSGFEPAPKRPKHEHESPIEHPEILPETSRTIFGQQDKPPIVAESSSRTQETSAYVQGETESDSDGSFKIPTIIFDSDTEDDGEEDEDST